MIGGVEGLAERGWPGACLGIGKVFIGVRDLRLRCIMTAYHPDTLIRDKEITRDIYRRFGGKLALNCFVMEDAEITLGDEVQLVRGEPAPSPQRPRSSPNLKLRDAWHVEFRAALRALDGRTPAKRLDPKNRFQTSGLWQNGRAEYG